MSCTLRAICGRSAVRVLSGEGSGEIIAIHSKSVYIRLKSGGMLLLSPLLYGEVPFAAAFEDFSAVLKCAQGKEGCRVDIVGSCIYFSSDEYIKVEITNRDAGGVAHTPQHLPDKDTVCGLALFLMENASERGMSGAIAPLIALGTPPSSANSYALCAAGEADLIERAFLCGDTAALGESIRRLVGLGMGLTPSGDDLICGMLYAFGCFSAVSDDCAKCRDMLRCVLDTKMLMRTNEISAQYILSAVRGEYYEVVDRVLRDITSTDDSSDITQLLTSVRGLLSVGASSGSDILCGILFASYVASLF